MGRLLFYLGLTVFVGCGNPDMVTGTAKSPNLQDTNRVQFVVTGDTGHLNSTHKDVANAMMKVCSALGCDFGILLGDNVYPKGLNSAEDNALQHLFLDSFGTIGIPFYAVLGNHDYGKLHASQRGQFQVEWASHHEHYVMPATAYQFKAGSADFWGLDTNYVFWKGGDTQGEWLNNTLSQSKGQWRVAFGHHPYRSNGKHGNAGQYEGVRHIPFLSGNALKKFYETYVCNRFDLVFSGHDHNLQWIEACNTHWVVSGSGSSAKPVIDRGNPSVFSAETPGFVWVELGDVGTIVFYDAKGNRLYASEIQFHPK